METFTAIHVLISLIGILSGLVVMFGMLARKRFDRWTVLFLATTVATSVTGFFFPFHGVTPAIVARARLNKRKHKKGKHYDCNA